MKSICISCHTISELKKVRECNHMSTGLHFVGAAFFIPFGLLFPILFIGTFFFVIKGIIHLAACYDTMSLCPECNTRNVLPADYFLSNGIELDDRISKEDLQIKVLEYGKIGSYLIYKRIKVCTFCQYIGLNWEQQHFSLIMGSLFLGASLLFVPLAQINPLLLILSYIAMFFAISIILASLSNSKKCPKCEYKSLIPIDSRGGKFILEEKSINFSTPIRSSRIPTISYDNGIFYTAFILILATYIYYRLFLYFNSLN